MVELIAWLIFLALGTWLTRLVAKRLLRDKWQEWPVRRTVDAFLFFTVGFVLILTVRVTLYTYYTPGIFDHPERWNLVTTNAAVKQSIRYLAILDGIECFGRNAFANIILPTFVVALACWYVKGFKK